MLRVYDTLRQSNEVRFLIKDRLFEPSVTSVRLGHKYRLVTE